MSGDAVASAAVRRRQRLLTAETHHRVISRTDHASKMQIQALLEGLESSRCDRLGLGYIDPASTEYDGTGPHFVRRPTTFRSVESKRPDYLLKQVDPSLVCILEAKAANKEQKTQRAATSDIREYIEVNAFCKYLREMEHEQMVAIGTDGLRWTLWRSHLHEDTQGQVCRVDLTEVLRAISRRLDVIEGQTDWSANDVRNRIEGFVNHFAANRLPNVID